MNFRKLYCDALNVELPTEFEVHHIDMNRENNVIQNLVAIPVKLHRHYHNCQLMSFPESERLIPIMPPQSATSLGNDFFKLVLAPAFYEFEKIYYEIQKWIEYRDHLIFGFPNRNGLSYSNEQADRYIWLTNKEKKAKTTSKKKTEPCYAEVVAVWCESYPLLGFNAASGKCINDIISKTRTVMTGRGKEATCEAIVNSFKYVIAYVKRERHFCDGKPLTTWNSQYLSIVHEIANGKRTTKTPTTRERINSL